MKEAGDRLLEAVAYGDAAGLPVETWTAKQIRTTYGWLDYLEDMRVNPFFEGHYGAGMWSDDTQLSLAVATSLIEADGFDIASQAEAHIQAYDSSVHIVRNGTKIPRGWGGSTVQSIQRLKEGVLPSVSGEVGGAGNGVLMKLAPLALWHTLRGTEEVQRYAEVDALTVMTHNSSEARVTSRVHSDILQLLLQVEQEAPFETQELAEGIIERAKWHEAQLDVPPVCSTALGYLALPYLECRPQDILKHTDGKGFYAPQTLAMAYGVFIHNMSDFGTMVYTAVNLGGDTDSTASIVGAMSAMYEKGDITLPQDAEMLYERPMLQDVSRSLTAAAMKNSI
jgi:ADP-ribosylglycohydrolase